MLDKIKNIVHWCQEHEYSPVEGVNVDELLWLIDRVEKYEKTIKKLENTIEKYEQKHNSYSSLYHPLLCWYCDGVYDDTIEEIIKELKYIKGDRDTCE
ncbi:hypothetical protein BH753_gp078 [Bacillus phage Shbh1]|uniref:Uncharacterized protein n=1 Tax=Bacillus phage Shbh1 TaxID=1796992 RepID=A0A142F1A3_9CAUD|nr:hypothetical protein BH753_gp078 [Bacillus phage Shbh1]AMQ66560.1 hypothetical protein [Bacillus phage Shbh1]